MSSPEPEAKRLRPGCNGEAENDLLLLQRARGGDNRAFEALIRRYENRVAATAIGLLGPGQDAEDVGQNTFIRFHRSLHRFRGDSQLGTYLVRITLNLGYTKLRKRKLWRSVKSLIHDQAPRFAPSPAPGVDSRRQVIEALQALDSGQRAVVVLRHIHGYSTGEAARILNLPLGTVLSRLARAQKKMRARLEAPRDAKEGRDG